MASPKKRFKALKSNEVRILNRDGRTIAVEKTHRNAVKPRMDSRAGTNQLAVGTRQYDKLAKAGGDTPSYGETMRAESLYKALPHEEKRYQEARHKPLDTMKPSERASRSQAKRTNVEGIDAPHQGVWFSTPYENSYGEVIPAEVATRKGRNDVRSKAHNRLDGEETRQEMKRYYDGIAKKAREWAISMGLSADEADAHARTVRASKSSKSVVTATIGGYVGGKPYYTGYRKGVSKDATAYVGDSTRVVTLDKIGVRKDV